MQSIDNFVTPPGVDKSDPDFDPHMVSNLRKESAALGNLEGKMSPQTQVFTLMHKWSRQDLSMRITFVGAASGIHFSYVAKVREVTDAHVIFSATQPRCASTLMLDRATDLHNHLTGGTDFAPGGSLEIDLPDGVLVLSEFKPTLKRRKLQ